MDNSANKVSKSSAPLSEEDQDWLDYLAWEEQDYANRFNENKRNRQRSTSNKDYSRDAAHERYEKAAALAANAGSHTQAGLNEAYKQLNQNASWTPEEGWADNYQEGEEALIPSWLTSDEEAFPSYPTVQAGDSEQKPASMSIDWDGLAKKGEDVKRENKRAAAIAYPELRPQYEKELSDNLNSYNQRELQWYKDRAKSDLVATWPLGDEEGLQEELAKIDAWTSVPSGVYADERRRWYDENGNLSSNPNVFGITSQQKTPQAVRDIYDYYNSIYGNREEGDWKTWGKPITSTTPEGEETTEEYSPVVKSNDIDDGTSNESREKPMMTGRQYLDYRNLYGLPGRPTNEIDPDEIYNKQEELEEYGFIPYITSDESLNNFHNVVAPQAIGSAFNNLADARRSATDWTLDYEGEKYSGKDFVKSMQKYANEHQGDKGVVTDNPEEANEYSLPLKQYVIFPDGSKYTMPHSLPEPEYLPSGAVRFTFDDGTSWTFKDYDELASVKWDYDVAKEGEPVTLWWNKDPVKLSNGQAIRYDKAADLYEDQDKYADYGPLDINKPYVENPLEEGGWVPWLVDMALSSAPYFYLPAAGVKAIGDTANNAQGFRSGRQDYRKGTYNLLSENPYLVEAAPATIASAVMPLTEQLWGPVGKTALGGSPTAKLASFLTKGKADKYTKPVYKELLDETKGNQAKRILTNALVGASDEGLEEIPGELVEEFQSNGLHSFANPIYMTDKDTGELVLDSNGKPIPDADLQNRERKDTKNTSVADVIRNYINRWPLAYLGGASLGGLIGGPSVVAEDFAGKEKARYRKQVTDNLMEAIQSSLDAQEAQSDESYEEHAPDVDNIISEALRNNVPDNRVAWWFPGTKKEEGTVENNEGAWWLKDIGEPDLNSINGLRYRLFDGLLQDERDGDPFEADRDAWLARLAEMANRPELDENEDERGGDPFEADRDAWLAHLTEMVDRPEVSKPDSVYDVMPNIKQSSDSVYDVMPSIGEAIKWGLITDPYVIGWLRESNKLDEPWSELNKIMKEYPYL